MNIALIFQLVLFGVAAYLLGSIPSAVWIGKRFYNIDVREHGSHNAGTTNVLRVLGYKAALPVLLIDVLKGLAAVLLAYFISRTAINRDSETFGIIKIALGLMAIVGHMYPVLAGFRGGKGVATTLGIAIAICPYATLTALGIFTVIFVITKIVSISSMSAGVALPLTVIFLFKESALSVCLFSLFVCVLLFYTHRKNIGRLLNGTEPKTVFKKKVV
jgi:glycerol-3-phosphate acyltransferase PlsY